MSEHKPQERSPSIVPLHEISIEPLEETIRNSEAGGHDAHILSIARILGHNDPEQMVRYKETGGRGHDD